MQQLCRVRTNSWRYFPVSSCSTILCVLATSFFKTKTISSIFRDDTNSIAVICKHTVCITGKWLHSTDVYLNLHTQYVGSGSNTSHLYLGSACFKSCQGTIYPDWEVSWLSPTPPSKFWDSTLKETRATSFHILSVQYN